MRLTVGGIDRTEDWATVCRAEALALLTHPEAPRPLNPFHSPRLLREATDERDYLKKLIDLMLLKAGLSAEDFYIPRRSGCRGWLSAALKRILWKLLRYQHERLVFQQNAVNTQIAVVLQFLMEESRERLAELEQRLERVEIVKCPKVSSG